MLNSILKESFVLLEKNIKELGQTNFKDYIILRKDSLNRINDTIKFINFNIKDCSLEDIKNELISLQKDFKKFKDELLAYEKVNYFGPLILIIDSYISNSLSQIEKEIDKALQVKEQVESDKTTSCKVDNSNSLKVKVFKSAFAEDIEDSINKFLLDKEIEITDKIQSIENNTICITIFYKIK